MLNIKISDEQMAKLGLKTEKDVFAALELSSQATIQLQETVSKNETLSASVVDLEGKFKALEVTVNALPKFDAAFKTDLLTAAGAKAKEVSSQEVASILAKVPGQTIGQGDKPADVSTKKEEAQHKGTDYAAHWNADEKLQAEFLSAESYAAFQKADKKNAFKLFTK